MSQSESLKPDTETDPLKRLENAIQDCESAFAGLTAGNAAAYVRGRLNTMRADLAAIRPSTADRGGEAAWDDVLAALVTDKG